ncbi:MAG TPA: GatB/YqeY domain-containing protein [Gammaproteobacteria bacterium]|nr:GatB/YqeY domain-containing protein [Gammaproteobacteria bacterium]
MSLKQTITDDMKNAMRAGDKPRLGVIRLTTAAIKQIEVDERIDLQEDDTRVISIIDKMIKQRRESISQFEKASRDDLVKQEEFEITVLQPYLPAALSADEIESLVNEAIEKSGAASIKDMGKVMGILKPQMAGRADMGKVSQTIKARLS